jgi:phage terminase large subunit-like protein
VKLSKSAQHAIGFIERFNLVGDYHGQRVKLRPWQREIFARLFATKQGKRLVRRCLLMLPRKSSKTFMAATICLYALLTFGKNQVVLSAAASQEQANRIYDAMVEIIRQDDFLNSICQIVKNRIVVPQLNSYYCAVTSGGKSAHGHNPTVLVCDEYHAWIQDNHKELFSALSTGRGARKEPLTIMISTQTSDRYSLAGEEFEYARSLKGRIENGVVKTDGTIDNPSYLAVLYYANNEDDWHSEALWRRVSPALGDFLDIEDYREQYRIACDIPSRQQVFKTLYLNMPCDEQQRWMDFDRWKACSGTVDPGQLEGAECWAGLDLAPVHDLSALTLVFPVDGKLKVLSFSWCSQEDITARSRVEKVPYDIWAGQTKETKHRQFIKATPGNATDFEVIRKDIVELSKKYRIKTLAADKVHAYQLGQQLAEAGINVQWFGQGFISMGPATARTEKLVREGGLIHPSNPVLDYCVHNVRCEPDAAGNLKPSNRLKLRHERIDCAVALIMAVGVWLDAESQQQGSVYDTGGLFIV